MKIEKNKWGKFEAVVHSYIVKGQDATFYGETIAEALKNAIDGITEKIAFYKLLNNK